MRRRVQEGEGGGARRRGWRGTRGEGGRGT